MAHPSETGTGQNLVEPATFRNRMQHAGENFVMGFIADAMGAHFMSIIMISAGLEILKVDIGALNYYVVHCGGIFLVPVVASLIGFASNTSVLDMDGNRGHET